MELVRLENLQNQRAYFTTIQSLIIHHQQLTINNHPQSCHAVSIPLVAQHYGVPNETFTR
jgi:hypothetical protein